MPPITVAYEHINPSWTSTAPYNTRIRQRTSSVRSNDSPRRAHDARFPSNAEAGNILTSSPLRGNTASSDSSTSSHTSSIFSHATNSTASLVDSPDATKTESFEHRRNSAGHPYDTFSSARARLASSNVLSRQLSTDHRLQPPMAEALAPLQLDPTRARELEQEPPLALPRPWAMEKEYSGIGHVPMSRSQSLSRSRSRSPDRPKVHHPSVIPPDVPKTKFVEGLVGAACIAVEVVWKLSDSATYSVVNGLPTPTVSPTRSSVADQSNVLPLRHFIKEVLRRSRSTCSTLQTALYYIHKSRDTIRERVRAAEDAKAELTKMQRAGVTPASWNATSIPSPPYDMDMRDSASTAAKLLQRTRDPVLCGRRMFLAALICASKFLQDRTYSNRAWAKISSLPVSEINANEKAFLELLDYNLFVNADLFMSWTRRLQDLAEKQERKVAQAAALHSASDYGSKTAVPMLREGLYRSQSEYLPAPEQTDVARISGSRSGSAFPHPLTPSETPKFAALHGDSSPSGFTSRNSYHGLLRSQTETRFEQMVADRKLPPLGSGPALGRLPLPSLSLKIPQYIPPSPSPLSGRAFSSGFHVDDDVREDERPSLSRRPLSQTRRHFARGNLGDDGLRLPRPILADSLSRSNSSSSLEAHRLTRNGSCSSLARLLNNDSSDWATGENMVL